MKFTKVFYLIFCVFFIGHANAQSELLTLSQDLNLQLGKKIYFKEGKQNHTAILPYVVSNLDSLGQDSLMRNLLPNQKDWQSKNWLFRKIFQEHLVEIDNEEYSFYIDFLPDMQIGKQGSHNIWLNTRGIEAGGRIGNKFSFTSYFYENQGKFPAYLTDYIDHNLVVPGQGNVKPLGNGGFDYSYSGGRLSYTPSKYLNFQAGFDKNFIGDGYRSLLLSDNAFNYPFFKATATVGRVQFMTMWAQFTDFSESPRDDMTPFPKKNGVFHYLSWNVNKRLNVGFFENIMWKPRGFEFSYANTLLFLRPQEFATGSPDKVTIGFNANYKIADRYVAYGQLMINEFTLKEVFANTGFAGNKQGGQLGLKGFDIFKVKKLNAQIEINRVRPYAYSATDHYKNYGHYAQPLAHPYGANFKELLGIVNYNYKRLGARLQLTTATYGLDYGGQNFGKDIYKSYLTSPNEYGVFIGNGLKTNLIFADAKLYYLLNPKNNLRIEFGYTYRKESNNQYVDRQQFLNIGLRASFRNIYTDF